MIEKHIIDIPEDESDIRFNRRLKVIEVLTKAFAEGAAKGAREAK